MHSQRIKYAEYIFQPQMCSSDKYIFCIPVVPQNELTCNEIVKYGTINNVSIRNILITLWDVTCIYKVDVSFYLFFS